MNKKSESNLNTVIIIIVLISLIVLSIILWIIYGIKPDETNINFTWLPTLNATFNALSVLFIISGLIAIKRNNKKTHISFMISALICSTFFLIGYLIYHYTFGDTIYIGRWRPLYLVILISHILTSIIVIPLVISTIYFAITKRLNQHKVVAKFTYPIWLYLSISGIIIFIMLTSSY